MSKKNQKSKIVNPDLGKIPLTRYYENLTNATRAIIAKPKDDFLNEIAEITGRNPETVRTWCLGINTPPPHVREKIANHMKSKPEILFPETT